MKKLSYLLLILVLFVSMVFIANITKAQEESNTENNQENEEPETELDENEDNDSNLEEDDEVVVNRMRTRAGLLVRNQIQEILSEIKETRNQEKERNVEQKQLKKLSTDMKRVSEAARNSINSFITYGVDENTKRLGEGERAAVIHSFKEAFEKLPETEEELTDVIKISNGRWPSKMSEKGETKAKERFREIYKRELRESNSHDMSAMKIMAYGLKQRAENRNLESERRGIKIFEDIFGHVPSSTEDWNAMQAITYSGATR